jgi:uncharacterized protein (DUF302 family)
MMNQQQWILPIIVFILSPCALSGVVFYKQHGFASQGDHPMDVTRITVEHIRVASEKPFEHVTGVIAKELGRFDPEVYQVLGSGTDLDKIRARIAAMAGPSGFMLFGTSDHGGLLRLANQKKKAIQYVLGNPLFAFQMTQHDIRAALYAPLRVLVYENEQGRTCVEYDKPSSLFDQFGNARLKDVATILDRKLEDLVAKAFH